MFLREYDDVVCLPRQLVVQRGLVLPETFTTVERHRQRNAFLTKTGVDFAQPPGGLDAAVPLRGRWFYLDNHMVGHFGHALSEQLSHLWGWHWALEPPPVAGRAGVHRVRVAHRVAARPPVRRWRRSPGRARGSGAAAGGDAGRLHPQFSRPAFVHPAIRATYDAVGSGSRGPGRHRSETGRGASRDRRGAKRACTNAEELLAEFTAAGFEVIHPEDHPSGRAGRDGPAGRGRRRVCW